jgi:hypothetical protein
LREALLVVFLRLLLRPVADLLPVLDVRCFLDDVSEYVVGAVRLRSLRRGGMRIGFSWTSRGVDEMMMSRQDDGGKKEMNRSGERLKCSSAVQRSADTEDRPLHQLVRPSFMRDGVGCDVCKKRYSAAVVGCGMKDA